MINEQVSKENWKRLKDDLQKEWNFISSAELDQTKGSLKSIYGLISQKCGLHQQEVKDKLVSILKKY